MSEEFRDEILQHLKELKKIVGENKTKIEQLDEALRGDLKTSGWLRRIETLEACASTSKRITMAAVVATIGSIVTALFQVLKGHTP